MGDERCQSTGGWSSPLWVATTPSQLEGWPPPARRSRCHNNFTSDTPNRRTRKRSGAGAPSQTSSAHATRHMALPGHDEHCRNRPSNDCHNAGCDTGGSPGWYNPPKCNRSCHPRCTGALDLRELQLRELMQPRELMQLQAQGLRQPPLEPSLNRKC